MSNVFYADVAGRGIFFGEILFENIYTNEGRIQYYEYELLCEALNSHDIAIVTDSKVWLETTGFKCPCKKLDCVVISEPSSSIFFARSDLNIKELICPLSKEEHNIAKVLL